MVYGKLEENFTFQIRKWVIFTYWMIWKDDGSTEVKFLLPLKI